MIYLELFLFPELSFISINFLLKTGLAKSHRIWSVVALFSFASRYLFLFSLIYSVIHWLFSSILFSNHMFVFLCFFFFLLAYRVSAEKSAYILLKIHFNVLCFFSLDVFNILFFTSWTWLSVSFLMLEKFSAIMSSNISQVYYVPLFLLGTPECKC